MPCSFAQSAATVGLEQAMFSFVERFACRVIPSAAHIPPRAGELRMICGAADMETEVKR